MKRKQVCVSEPSLVGVELIWLSALRWSDSETTAPDSWPSVRLSSSVGATVSVAHPALARPLMKQTSETRCSVPAPFSPRAERTLTDFWLGDGRWCTSRLLKTSGSHFGPISTEWMISTRQQFWYLLPNYPKVEMNFLSRSTSQNLCWNHADKKINQLLSRLWRNNIKIKLLLSAVGDGKVLRWKQLNEAPCYHVDDY